MLSPRDYFSTIMVEMALVLSITPWQAQAFVAINFTSVLDNVTIVCFLEDHDTTFVPSRRI